MYDYIFLVIYRWGINKNKSHWLSAQHACNGVSFALLIHIGLVIEVLKNYFVSGFTKFSSASKSIVVIGVVLIFIVVRLYYNHKRISRIKDKLQPVIEKHRFNGLIVFGLIFIPLIITIFIGWK